MTTKELQKQIETVMSVQQDLDHETLQLGREVDDLKGQFKSLTMDAVTHAEQDVVNSDYMVLISTLSDILFRSFDRIGSKLSRLAVAVIIAIIIGVTGCIL